MLVGVKSSDAIARTHDMPVLSAQTGGEMVEAPQTRRALRERRNGEGPPSSAGEIPWTRTRGRLALKPIADFTL